MSGHDAHCFGIGPWSETIPPHYVAGIGVIMQHLETYSAIIWRSYKQSIIDKKAYFKFLFPKETVVAGRVIY
jgi:hypothetical protein